MSTRSMAVLLGGTLALWIALVVWAIASDPQVWKEIESDSALLEALRRPGTRATVRELGLVVHRRHPAAMRAYNPIDIGRVLKMRYRPQYDAYADVPNEDIVVPGTGLEPGSPLWMLLFGGK
jgi:hypothetical protein